METALQLGDMQWSLARSGGGLLQTTIPLSAGRITFVGPQETLTFRSTYDSDGTEEHTVAIVDRRRGGLVSMAASIEIKGKAGTLMLSVGPLRNPGAHTLAVYANADCVSELQLEVTP